jgi:hypothetical protein
MGDLEAYDDRDLLKYEDLVQMQADICENLGVVSLRKEPTGYSVEEPCKVPEDKRDPSVDQIDAHGPDRGYDSVDEFFQLSDREKAIKDKFWVGGYEPNVIFSGLIGVGAD